MQNYTNTFHIQFLCFIFTNLFEKCLKETVDLPAVCDIELHNDVKDVHTVPWEKKTVQNAI